MNISNLFFALSQAMLFSLAQGLLMFFLLKFVIYTTPGITASGRFRLFYSSLILVFISFVVSVFKFYSEAGTWTEHPVSFTSEMSDQPASAALAFKSWLELNSFWIAGFYFLGLTIQAILLISGLIKIKQIRNQQKTNLNFVWDIRLGRLGSRLKINKEVSLYFSDKILIPLTAGYIKPIILFPVAMVNRLSLEQVEAILLHELAHIKRDDYALNILQRIMEIILFFNPLVWLMRREIEKEREFCCDDLVVEYCNNPDLYASALALLEENKINNLRLALAANDSSKYPLLNRIKRITTMKTLKNNPKQQLLAIISIVAIGLSLAWAIPSDRTKVKRNDPKDSLLLPLAPLPPVAPIAPLSNVATLPPLPILNKEPKILIAPLAPQAPEAPLFLAAPLPPPADTSEVKKYFNSPEWKKHQDEMKKMAEEMKKQFNSPEWKKQIEEMKIAGEEMKKQFNSPEWKKQVEEMKIAREKMKKQFESPEWKKHTEQMKIEAEKMEKQAIIFEKKSLKQ